MVTEPATEYCTKQVQPYLPAILEEVMGPISLGFTEARDLSEGMMQQLCEDFQDVDQKEELRQVWKMNKYTINHHKKSICLVLYFSKAKLFTNKMLNIINTNL